MKRGILVPLVAFLASLFSLHAQADWIRDPVRHFFLDVPAGWFANGFRDERNGGADVFAAAAPDGSMAVRVRSSQATRATRRQDLKAAFEKQVLPGATLVDSGNARLSSRQALRATYQWSLDGTAYDVVAFFLVGEKFSRYSAYTLWRLVPAERKGELAATAGRVARSFSLLRPRGYRRVFGRRQAALPGSGNAPEAVRVLLGDMATAPAAPEPAAPRPMAAPAEPAPEPVKPAPAPDPVVSTAPEPAPVPVAEGPPVPATPEKPAVDPYANRPQGESKCLDVTLPDSCGCGLAALQPAFKDLERAYLELTEKTQTLGVESTALVKTMDDSGEGCPQTARQTVTDLSGRAKAMGTEWVRDRLEKLRICGRLFVSRMTERRRREGSNPAIRDVILSIRAIKYDSLLLLAEFEKLDADLSDIDQSLSDRANVCKLIHESPK